MKYKQLQSHLKTAIAVIGVLMVVVFFMSALLISIAISGCSRHQPVEVLEPISAPIPSQISLAWESKNPSGAWTAALMESIENHWPTLKWASDAPKFCPKWNSLDEETKKIAFAEMLVATSYHECGWNPTKRMTETTMGIDPVTGKQVVSEGMFQLSYQDQRSYKIDCGFDWSIDKSLSVTDPRKTILDPEKNIRCAVTIMARQVKNKNAVFLSSGVYWAVLKVNGKYSKIPDIVKRTRARVPACG